jgi:hypothetical protein
MKGVYSIAEVVEDSIKNPNKTIFIVLNEDDDKKFDKQELNSLNEVCNLIIRNKGKCFNNFNDIVDYLKGKI